MLYARTFCTTGGFRTPLLHAASIVGTDLLAIATTAASCLLLQRLLIYNLLSFGMIIDFEKKLSIVASGRS